MARNIDDIQRDIERNRTQLAQTLDELSTRTNPKYVADDAKARVSEGLQDPKVQAVIGGVVAVVLGGIALSIARNRKRSKEIERLREMIEAASR